MQTRLQQVNGQREQINTKDASSRSKAKTAFNFTNVQINTM